MESHPEAAGDLLRKLGQEFQNRLKFFHKVEPCMAFIPHPFLEVDASRIPEQMAERFNVTPVEMQTDITTLPQPRNLQEYSSSSSGNIGFIWLRVLSRKQMFWRQM